MAIATFGICLMISCGIILYMSSKEYENIDRYYWTIVILIPIIIPFLLCLNSDIANIYSFYIFCMAKKFITYYLIFWKIYFRYDR